MCGLLAYLAATTVGLDTLRWILGTFGSALAFTGTYETLREW